VGRDGGDGEVDATVVSTPTRPPSGVACEPGAPAVSGRRTCRADLRPSD